jgi:aminoglycoside phosphotransferase family enzyme/predicted kinase
MLPPHISAMLRPEFYPHATAEICLLQTHASFVVLTGPYAYKLKKPVDFGFLDYTTLEKRKHFCLEELRLNKRFSPELYLDVLSVQQQAGGFGLGDLDATGVTDFCLRMRQFDQADLLNRRITEGRIELADLETFTANLAELHRTAPVHTEVDGAGRVRRVVQDNFPVLCKFAGSFFSQSEIDRLEADCMHRLEASGELISARARGGRFRECHGDLHTGNVAYVDGTLHAFDAIEFNERFRIIDVLAEVAFWVMDLEALGLPEEANRCLNIYLEESGDWDGAPLLPLYLIYRALVRAKIGALTAADEKLTEKERSREEEKAKRYFELACRFLDRFSPGKSALAIMFGLSGSGKSTVARRLAEERGAIQIRSDAVRKHLAGVPLRGRPADKDIYTLQYTEKTFRRMGELAGQALEAGISIVLDGRYARRDERDAARAVAEKAAVPFEMHVCEAPPEELHRRLASRQGDVSDATAELLERQAANTEPLAEEELRWVVRTDL